MEVAEMYWYEEFDIAPDRYFVYILKCLSKNGVYYYYKGYTKNLERRLNEHIRGHSKYTRRYHGNIELVYVEIIYNDDEKEGKSEAIKREKEFKKLSREAIERLISDYDIINNKINKKR